MLPVSQNPTKWISKAVSAPNYHGFSRMGFWPNGQKAAYLSLRVFSVAYIAKMRTKAMPFCSHQSKSLYMQQYL